MRDIMNLAKDLINTVRESPKRMDIFKTILAVMPKKTGRIGLRPLCPTRWTMRASSMKQILNNYASLSEFFLSFSESGSCDAASKCSGYFEQMSKFKTLFLISLYSFVMSPIEEVNTQLQSPHITAPEVFSKLDCLRDVLQQKREEFETFWQNVVHDKPRM
uniref:Uncharacterized protein LOC114345000 n=1 Tax=Diabrotica virgifera virgifera TaxID=50390 RepID=A0A6P7GZN1_DIAVI